MKENSKEVIERKIEEMMRVLFQDYGILVTLVSISRLLVMRVIRLLGEDENLDKNQKYVISEKLQQISRALAEVIELMNADDDVLSESVIVVASDLGDEK